MAEMLLYVGKINLTAAIVILLTALISEIIGQNYSARWKYHIWLLLGILMLLPVRVPENWNMVQIEVPVFYSDQGSLSEKYAEKQRKQGGVLEQKNGGIQQRGAEESDLGVMPDEGKNRRIMPEHIDGLLAVVWGSGILVVGTRKLLNLYLGKKELQRWNVPNWDRNLGARYRSVCRAMKVKHIPELMLNSRLETPLLSGFLHPCICLPTDGYTAEEQELIFCHELCHYCRKDLGYKFFMELVCILYWFNPALWWMKGEAERNIEFLCDETVMQGRTVSEKLIYSRLLAKTAAGKKTVQGIFTGLNDSLVTLKKRMANIMRAGRMKKGTAITACLLMVFLLANSLTACSFQGDDGTDLAITGENEPSGEVSPEPKNAEEESGYQQEDEIQRAEPQILDSEPFFEEEKDSDEEQTSDRNHADENPDSVSAEENQDNPEDFRLTEEENPDSEEVREQEAETGSETENPVSPTVTPEPVVTEVPQTPELSEPDIELLDYMNSNQVQEFADAMGLQQSAGQMFGESGMRYESSEIGIEWQYKNESFYDWGIEESMYDFIGSVWCEGNTQLGVHGISCGMDMEEARSRMASENWSVIGTRQQAFLKEDATGYNREYVQFETDGTKIVSWYWCNWPEGDF